MTGGHFDMNDVMYSLRRGPLRTSPGLATVRICQESQREREEREEKERKKEFT
jgi:hypothetical protein